MNDSNRELSRQLDAAYRDGGTFGRLLAGVALAVALERGGSEAPDLALRPTRIVVIGDGTFVSNGSLAMRGNANRDFFLNSVAWLAGLDTLGAARTPGNVVVTGLDRDGWLKFGAWSGVLILLFAAIVKLTAIRRR